MTTETQKLANALNVTKEQVQSWMFGGSDEDCATVKQALLKHLTEAQLDDSLLKGYTLDLVAATFGLDGEVFFDEDEEA